VKIDALEELRNYPEMKDMVIKEVAALLESGDSNVALEAAVTLKTFGDPRGEKFFADFLGEKGRDFQERAIEYAGTYTIEAAVPFLLKKLKSEDWYMRYIAVDALGKIKSELAFPSLKVLFEEEEVLPVRIAIARVFYNYAHPDSIGFLKHRTTIEKNVDIRWFIIATIGEIGTDEAVWPLIIALMDSDEKIRLTAVMALRRITGQNFGYSARAPGKERSEKVRLWEQWYKRNLKPGT
jgi:HEAT repeat protein